MLLLEEVKVFITAFELLGQIGALSLNSFVLPLLLHLVFER